MSGTQHPPSTYLARPARQTLIATLCALAVLAVALVVVTSSRSGQASASEPARVVATARPEQDGRAILAGVEGVAEAIAPPIPAAPAPPPSPAPRPVVSGLGYNDPANPAAWDRLARCESSGNWADNTGNGYYGGIQFSLASWHGVGGSGRPDQASRTTQIAMGQRLWHQGGWAQWPSCSRQLGYR